jgi:hypothetical protein
LRFFYDTEFLDDGQRIGLISIGIVAEDGREYYAINADAPWPFIYEHDWLMENVIPYLGIIEWIEQFPGDFYPVFANFTQLRFSDQIAKDVMTFLDPDPEDYRHTELWAWCGAYDHVGLYQQWGPMESVHGTGLPFYTHDLKSIHDLFLDDEQREELRNLPFGGDAHNALDDARQLRDRWEYVNRLIRLDG